jgi:hypothetical protein
MFMPLAVLFLTVGITGASANLIKGAPNDEGLSQARTAEIAPARPALRKDLLAAND